MKKSLLATVAAVALIAGPALAQKQEAPASGSQAPARAPSSMQNAPAEKVAPSGPVSGERAAPSERSGAAERGAQTTKPERSTTGQAQPRDAQDTPRRGQSGPDGVDSQTDRSGDRPGGRASERDGKPGDRANDRTGDRDGERRGPDSASKGQAGGNVALTTEQRTRIRSTVLTNNAPRVTNVNFSVNVGTVVPRSVRVVAVPAPLIEIHPEWRGYMYFVHDDRIIIVEPDTLRIVTVLVL